MSCLNAICPAANPQKMTPQSTSMLSEIRYGESELTVFNDDENILLICLKDFFILIHDGKIEQVQAVLESCDSKQKLDLLDSQDPDGNTPLHFAARLKKEEIVSLLIQHGASLAIPNLIKCVPMASVLYLTDCHNHVKEKLDNCVSFTKSSKGEKEFVSIDIDRVFFSDKNKKLSDVIYQMAIQGKEKSQEILIHPVCQAFVAVQRRKLQFLDTLYTTSYLLYVALFTSVCYEAGVIPHTGRNLTRSNSSLYEVNYLKALPSIVLGTVFSLANIAIFLLNLMSLRERLDEDERKRTLKISRGLENFVKIGHWMLISYPAVGHFLVVASIFVPLTEETEHQLSISFLFIWSEVIFRFESLGFAKLYVAMLRVVFFRFLKILFIFSPIFIGFSFAFTILFKEKHVIAVPNIFMNIIAMMSGELNTMDLFNEENQFLWVTSQVVFTSFIITSIIFMNLWIGLVVSDTQKLQENVIFKQMKVDIGRIRRDERFENLLKTFFPFLAIPDRKVMFEKDGSASLLIALTADLDCNGQVAESLNAVVKTQLEELANKMRKRP